MIGKKNGYLLRAGTERARIKDRQSLQNCKIEAPVKDFSKKIRLLLVHFKNSF